MLKEFNRRLSIDGVVIADNGTEITTIDDPVDVQSLSPGIAANFVVLSALDPAIAGNRIVVGMGDL